jgi:hypothetical protein
MAIAVGTIAILSDRAIAQGLRYVPPKLPARGGLQGTQGAGSRGQAGDLQVTLLTPFAPQPMGQTVAARPTFYWLLSTAPNANRAGITLPVTLDFTLMQRGVAQPLVFKRLPVKQLGLVKLEMPSGSPELKPGVEYRWTVSIVRDPVRRSLNPTWQSSIVRVPLSPELAQKLKATISERDRAALYAEASLWYDALNALGINYLKQPTDATRADLLSLLNQGGLSKLNAGF